MESLFIAATGIMIFVFTALAALLWKAMAFLKTASFDFRFLILILLAVAAKYVHDRAKVVLKEHTNFCYKKLDIAQT